MSLMLQPLPLPREGRAAAAWHPAPSTRRRPLRAGRSRARTHPRLSTTSGAERWQPRYMNEFAEGKPIKLCKEADAALLQKPGSQR